VGRPDDPGLVATVAAGREALRRDGTAVFPGFVPAEAVAAMVSEAERLAVGRHHQDVRGTPYLAPPDPDRPDGDPRRHLGRSSLTAIPYDAFPADSPLRAVYEDDDVLRFVAAVLDVGELHRYADPLGALNVAAMDEGDELAWHFDQTDFVVSIALQSSERGGYFECAELIRTAHDEQYERVAAVMDGDPEGRVRVVAMEPGTLLLFAGRRSLHRVSTVEGDRARHVALLGYDTASGTRSSESLQRVRYGRVA
jgi:hypothetical protein